MGTPRLFVRGEKGVYLCSSELHDWLGPVPEGDMELVRKYILDAAFFCDFEVITYAVVPTGFKVLVRTAGIKPWIWLHAVSGGRW